jgi:phage tail sheath gpL-like
MGGYTILVPAWYSQTALTALRTHINTYTDSVEQQSILGVGAVTSTISAATALAASLNSGSISLALMPGTTSTARQLAAAYAAMIASEEDPARPLNTLVLTGIAVPPVAKRLGRTEQETCLKNGVTPLEVGAGDVVQIVRAVSTYTKSAAGADDVSLLDLTTMRTLYYVRQACRERIRLRFPREKLSNKTPIAVRSELLDVLKKLEDLEIVEAVDDNAAGLVVERSAQDANRLNASIPTDVVNGLHVFAGRIDLLL